jgi:pimeloyl-ACP methyl ester carboxylesterase
LRAIAVIPESHRIEVEGCGIHYLRWGRRGLPGLVLVHGGAAHAHWWSFLAPLLNASHDVVALDLSGHGDSHRRSVYTRELWAREVIEVAHAAGFAAPPIVIGHSLGGLVAIVAASLWGIELAGAILVDSPVDKPSPDGGAAPVDRKPGPAKTYLDRESAIKRFRLIPEEPIVNPFIIDHIARHSVRQVDGGYTWKFDPAILRRVSDDSMRHHLTRIRCRVALLRGEHSVIMPPETAAYMVEQLSRSAPLVEIPEAYHHLFLQQPLAFVAAIRALLSDWQHSIPLTR